MRVISVEPFRHRSNLTQRLVELLTFYDKELERENFLKGQLSVDIANLMFQYIQKHYSDSDLSIDTVAMYLKVSKWKVREYSNLLFGKSIHKYVRQLVLTNPKSLSLEALQQTMPSGQLTSNGQEQVSAGFFAPFGTKKVRFSCQGGGALAPAFICRTHSFGVTKSKTEYGTLFTWKDIDVDIAASNVSVGIDFRTTDSNGGESNWKAML